MKIPSPRSIPFDSCVLPGHVTISDAAWRAVRTCSTASTGQNGRPQTHVVGFYWSSGGTMQRNATTPTETLPPGLGLGIYRRDQISPEVIHDHDGIECVVVVPANIMEKAQDRTIDVDEQARRGLILR